MRAETETFKGGATDSNEKRRRQGKRQKTRRVSGARPGAGERRSAGASGENRGNRANSPGQLTQTCKAETAGAHANARDGEGDATEPRQRSKDRRAGQQRARASIPGRARKKRRGSQSRPNPSDQQHMPISAHDDGVQLENGKTARGSRGRASRQGGPQPVLSRMGGEEVRGQGRRRGRHAPGLGPGQARTSGLGPGPERGRGPEPSAAESKAGRRGKSTKETKERTAKTCTRKSAERRVAVQKKRAQSRGAQSATAEKREGRRGDKAGRGPTKRKTGGRGAEAGEKEDPQKRKTEAKAAAQ